uniref:Putative secreted protein n=1 Tax=Ixodes ricinus TaxID=34613 RepID=A0A6B0VAV2_IXORI
MQGRRRLLLLLLGPRRGGGAPFLAGPDPRRGGRGLLGLLRPLADQAVQPHPLHVLLELRHQGLERPRAQGPQQGVHAAQVRAALPLHHGSTLLLQEAQVGPHHVLLALTGHLGVGGGMEEAPGPEVLLGQALEHTLHVGGAVALLEQPVSLPLVVLAGLLEEGALKHLLVQGQRLLPLVLLHLYEGVDDPLNNPLLGAVSLPVPGQSLQQQGDQRMPEGCHHVAPPQVQPQLPNLQQLLRGLHRAIAQVRLAQLVLLDVLRVQVHVQLVEIVNPLAILQPVLVVRGKQIIPREHKLIEVLNVSIEKLLGFLVESIAQGLGKRYAERIHV